MNHRETMNGRSASASGATPGAWTLARARTISPSLVRALVRPWLFFSHAWVKCALGIVGFLVQVVLLVLAWRLVEVVADISELWLALARKHLELTS